MGLMGERLKKLRERNGLTQEDVAARTGISSRQLQKYESGDADPSLDNAGKIAVVLGTTIDYLAGLVPESTPYIQGELSSVERLIILLFRRRKLSPQIHAAINEALRDDT